jgi:hypothetical protein
MEWSFAEFFADGGTTTFVDRMAASIGVHASQIKTVSVYEGSLVIDFFITALIQTAAEAESNPQATLAQIEQK